MEKKSNKTETKEIELILDGELMEGNSIDYKTLFEVIDGSVGAIEGFSRIANFNQVVSFRVKPPQKGSFGITIMAVQLLSNAVPLLPYLGTIKDVTSFFIEYLKIKKSLKGEDLKKENIQTNDCGAIIIKNNAGNVIYNDDRKLININIINKANEDPQINKKIDRIATALEKNEQIDTITFTESEMKENGIFSISKKETDYFKYNEKFKEESDSLVGYVRKIDNKTNNGMIVVNVGEKEKSISFELEIKDIKLLDKVVSNLALAEANKTRVLFFGEKTLDRNGNIKKIIVSNIDIVDKAFSF